MRGKAAKYLRRAARSLCESSERCAVDGERVLVYGKVYRELKKRYRRRARIRRSKWPGSY